MNPTAPFTPHDLQELDELFLQPARAVVPMREIHAGNFNPSVVAMRHDCDAGHSLATAVKMAHWEADRGYRSTYYVLHTSPYWDSPRFRQSLDEIALLGHEIGIHTNALAESLRTGEHPDMILERALDRLRSFGHAITGVVGHGDPSCRATAPEVNFANDEQFTVSNRKREREQRIENGFAPDEIVRGDSRLRVVPRPLADFGLEYDAVWVRESGFWRISDSGGKWKHADHEPAIGDAALLHHRQLSAMDEPAQLHLLVHPDWWADAFVREAVAA